MANSWPFGPQNSPSLHPQDPPKELTFDVISYIMRSSLGPFDVLRASAVNREWRRAAQEQYIWLAFVRWEFGETLLRKAMPPGSEAGSVDAKALYAQLACFTPGALTGWCEDPVTAGGQPYTMYMGEMSSSSHMCTRKTGSVSPFRPSLAHTRTIYCKSLWTYTVPNPRTKLRIFALGVQPEVLDGLRALPAATSTVTGAPLYRQRIKIVEYERIVGAVDVPNSYFAFRVGPVLLGCFLPPDVPLHVVALRTRKQMLGLIVLWDAGLALSGPATPEARLSLLAPSPSTGQRLQELSGLRVGEVYTGTVLTNWHERDAVSGLRLGHALLGCIRITCMEVAPLTCAAIDDASAALPTALKARFRVEVPEREWQISPQGLPIRYDAEEELSYTGASTEDAWVEVHPDGTLKPLEPPGSSLQERGRGAAAGCGALGHSLWGIASGGVLAGMLISRRNAWHRAVFAAFAETLGQQAR